MASAPASNERSPSGRVTRSSVASRISRVGTGWTIGFARSEAAAKGRIVGTVAYMSPEQAEGKPVDPRSDVFSLGVVIFEMATSQRPFTGETPLSLLSSIIKDTPATLTDLKADLPRDLARIVRRCLSKDPEDRYQTAKDLRNDLRADRGPLVWRRRCRRVRRSHPARGRRSETEERRGGRRPPSRCFRLPRRHSYTGQAVIASRARPCRRTHNGSRPCPSTV